MKKNVLKGILCANLFVGATNALLVNKVVAEQIDFSQASKVNLSTKQMALANSLSQELGLNNNEKASVEEIAQLLYYLTFNKPEGDAYWKLFGIDWNQPMSEDPQYLQDYQWWKESEKETLTLDNGNVGYFLENKGATKTVVLSHGYRGDASMMGPWAKVYYDLGYNLFAPDATSHGQSQGDLINFGWLEKDNYVDWLTLLTTEKAEQSESILLHGVSMGAATVLMTAGEELPSNVEGVIADSAYSSLEAELDYLKTFISTALGEMAEALGLTEENIELALPLLNELVKENFGFEISEVSTVNQVAKSKVPVGLIHSTDDWFIPASFEYDIFNNIASSKYLWTASGGNHIGGVHYDRDAYTATITDYIQAFSDEKNGTDHSLNKLQYIINYLDTDGNKLAESVTVHGKTGESIDVVIPEIEGYQLVQEIESQLVFGKSDEELNVVYEAVQSGGSSTSDSAMPTTTEEFTSDQESDSTETTDESSQSTTSESNDKELDKSKLPQTGEAKGIYATIGGVLLLGVLAFVSRKKWLKKQV